MKSARTFLQQRHIQVLHVQHGDAPLSGANLLI